MSTRAVLQAEADAIIIRALASKVNPPLSTVKVVQGRCTYLETMLKKPRLSKQDKRNMIDAVRVLQHLTPA